MTKTQGPIRSMKAAGLTAALVALSASGAAAATCPEGFPDGPIDFWVGYDAGGGTDLIARQIAAELEAAQGWSIAVTNIPGASSSVMMARLSGADADGMTIGLTSTGSISKVPNRNPDSPYTITDFSFLGTAQQTPIGIYTLADNDFDTYEEMIEHARESGNFTIASASVDSNIFFDAIAEREGVKITLVPAQGSTGSLQQILGGHVDAALMGTTAIEHMATGRLTGLFTLGDRRTLWDPDTPTTAELGYDFVGAVSYVLIAAPDGIEEPVLTCLEEAIDEAINSEGFGELMVQFENEAYNLGPEETTALLEREFAVFREYFGNGE
ncbi:tripartite tricarboxylate transporter substrate binding protein [Pseudoroseicyclus sp. CXY001]|uniref:tripartite tricarboxylate transporter substrate binding protein n=1 Tax=Pseudoroseicyclus sp. CXY001 TaxID=3242492 RepID=UPI00358DD0E1